MAHETIRPRRSERKWVVLLALKERPTLFKPEKLKMVDQKGSDQNRTPTGPEQDLQYRFPESILDRPDGSQERLPVSDHEQQGEARQQHIRASFGCFWDNLRPGALEPLPCHNAVLQSENRQ